MTRYNLVFQGQILEEASLDEVKANLARIFKADANKIDRLFSGKSIIIKRDLDSAAAQKYLSVFKQAGAEARAEEIVSDGTASAEHPRSAKHTDTTLSLSEPNAGEFPKVSAAPPLEIPDTSHLSMSPPQSGSLEEYTTIIAPVVIPNTDHISLNAPNSGSLEEFSRPVEAVELPDISAIDLAEMDGRDLADESSKPEPINIPDTGELSLSAAGTGSLEGLSSKAEAVKVPDTSHLEITPPQDKVNPQQGKAVFKID